MFQFLHRKKLLPAAELKIQHEHHEDDGIEQSVTKVALELIKGEGGVQYRRGMKKLFKKVPTLIQDVAPEHRDALEKELQRTDA